MDKEQLKLLETQLVQVHADIATRCACSMLNIVISYGYAPVLQGNWAWTVMLSYAVTPPLRGHRTAAKRCFVTGYNADLELAVNAAVSAWERTNKIHGSTFRPWVEVSNG